MHCGVFKYLTFLLLNISFHLVANDSRNLSYIETSSANPTNMTNPVILQPTVPENVMPNESTPLLADAPLNNPYSVFTPTQKRFIILAAALASSFSPLSANIYYPALNSIAADLEVSSSQINLTITTYMVRTPSFQRSCITNIIPQGMSRPGSSFDWIICGSGRS